MLRMCKLEGIDWAGAALVLQARGSDEEVYERLGMMTFSLGKDDIVDLYDTSAEETESTIV
jgi:hypothetical protein